MPIEMPACGHRQSNLLSRKQTYIENSIGEAGQPYRIPLNVLKGADGPYGPITKISPAVVARQIN